VISVSLVNLVGLIEVKKGRFECVQFPLPLDIDCDEGPCVVESGPEQASNSRTNIGPLIEPETGGFEIVQFPVPAESGPEQDAQFCFHCFDTDGFRRFGFPIWPVALTSGLPVLLMWWPRKHIRPGHCFHCDYDLTGNMSGVCPECGADTPERKNLPRMVSVED